MTNRSKALATVAVLIMVAGCEAAQADNLDLVDGPAPAPSPQAAPQTPAP